MFYFNDPAVPFLPAAKCDLAVHKALNRGMGGHAEIDAVVKPCLTVDGISAPTESGTDGAFYREGRG